MKKLIAIIPLLIALGCTKEESKPNPIKDFGCSIGKTMTLVFSANLSQALQCKNPSAVKEDLDEILVKIKVCEKAPDLAVGAAIDIAGIGGQICNMSAVTLFETLTAEKFAKWQCSGGLVKEELLKKAAEACSKIKF